MSRLKKAFRTNTGTIPTTSTGDHTSGGFSSNGNGEGGSSAATPNNNNNASGHSNGGTTMTTPGGGPQTPGPMSGMNEFVLPLVEKEIELEVPESHKAIADKTFFGLENFGNTCYCNSVLQALYHCVPFRQLVDSYPNPTPATIPNGPTPAEIAETFRQIEANGGKLPGYEHLDVAANEDAMGASSAEVVQEKTPNKARWSMGMGARKQSSSVLPTPTSPAARGGLARLHTNGTGAANGPTSPLSPGTPASSLPPTRQPTLPPPSAPVVSTPQPPRDPNLPPPSVLSAVQSLFNYIDSSPPHPPPPPKPPQEKPPGAETTGGTTLFNPHNPDRPFVRGGGPHGAGTMGKGVVKPEELVRAVKRENELFRGNMHQDAHEFLGWMLNKIAEDVEEIEKSMGREEREEREKRLGGLKRYGLGLGEGGSGKTLVHQLFEGLLTNETRCLTCETTSSRDESFLDLSIDIEQNSSVTSCLRQFSASEMLCQKNKFFCDTCCGLQEAEKSMKIKKLPHVLALHLKRFKYQESLGRFVKLAYRVVFPMQLRLFNTSDDVTNPDRLYELYAVVVHIGMGPNQGHYVALVKNEGRWLLYDDENVEPVDEADIPRYFGDYPAGAGYVLFYQAVDIDPVSLGLTKAPPVLVAEPDSIPMSTPATMESDLLDPMSSPTFSTNVPMLDVEPVGVAAAKMSAQAKVEAALADYQASVGRQPSMTRSTQASVPIPSSRQSTVDTRQNSVLAREPSHTPSMDHEPLATSTLGYEHSQGSLSKSEKSGSKWMPKFGATKDKVATSKRNSFYGSSARPASSTSNGAPGTSPATPMYTPSNGTSNTPTRQRTASTSERPGTASTTGTSALGVSPQADLGMGPGVTTPGSISRGATPAGGNMSSSFMSTMTASSEGTAPPARQAVPSASPIPAPKPQLAQSPPPSSRPNLPTNTTSSNASSLGLGRMTSKKDVPQVKDTRSTSGGSLSRRLSMNVPGLTRSSSAAFKSMLGGKKKDKET